MRRARAESDLQTAAPMSSRLLAALPAAEWKPLHPHLERISLQAGRVLYEPGILIESVYFPCNCVVSLLNPLLENEAIEVATVGNEGMVGMPLLLGRERDAMRATVQVPGEALRLSAVALTKQVPENPVLRERLHRYAYALLLQIAQIAACYRLHALEARLCCWLLITHNRVGSGQFYITQEFLAQMLGVRRPTLNAAATMLQQAGLIRYSRGKITVVDAAGLESGSCACYHIFNEQFAQVLSEAPS